MREQEDNKSGIRELTSGISEEGNNQGADPYKNQESGS
jgi:hypothetical protein